MSDSRHKLQVTTLRSLVQNWKAREREYIRAMSQANQIERGRYKGIATGLRWCYEDLEGEMSALLCKPGKCRGCGYKVSKESDYCGECLCEVDEL